MPPISQAVALKIAVQLLLIGAAAYMLKGA